MNITKTHPGNFFQGQQNAVYTVTVSNGPNAGTPSSSTITVGESLPAGLTLVSIAGTGWTCPAAMIFFDHRPACDRNDALAPGNSYPPITVTVNVAVNAGAQLDNSVELNYKGAATNVTDSTKILPAPSLSISKAHTGNFSQGQQGATYTVVVSNASGAASTNGTVTVTEAAPAGLTLVSMAATPPGTGWNCTVLPTCTRSDALAGGLSYPPITVTVNVATNAGASLTNTVSVSGGGSANANGSNVTIVTTNLPVLNIAKTHAGNFTQGQQNATYTLMVSNALGAGPTNGTVTVTEAAPAGLTLVSMAATPPGTGWNCTVLPTCTRSDALAGGLSYPPITVTVNVATNAGPLLTNTVNVSGGGSALASGSDSTTIVVGASNSCAGASTGSEWLLDGQYAILLQGFKGPGNGTPVAIAASFTADGLGGITGGEEDINNATAPQHLTITGGSYTVGSDSRGCLALTYTGGTTTSATFRFGLPALSLGVATKGRLIEYDDNSGTGAGTRVSGIMRKQNAVSFNANLLQARYMFGLDGVDFSSGHFAIAGSFDIFSGVISNGVFDVDDAGLIEPQVTATGSISSISSTTGRGLFTLSFGGAAFHEAIYMVELTEFFVIGTDPFSAAVPIMSGRAIDTAGKYTAASLSGNVITHTTGSQNIGGTVQADAGVGLLTFTPGIGQSGSFTGTIFDYSAGGGAKTTNFLSSSPGTYTVDFFTGRTVLASAGNTGLPVIYLAPDLVTGEPTVGFLVGSGTDANGTFGFAEVQPAATYSNSSLSGQFIFMTEDPGDNTVSDTVGTGTFSTAPAGQITIVRDISQISGLTDANSSTFNFTTNADGTGNAGANTVSITNGSKIFYINEAAGAPAVIRVFEK